MKPVDIFEEDTKPVVRDANYDSDARLFKEVPLSDSASIKPSSSNTGPTKFRMGGSRRRSSLSSGSKKPFQFSLTGSFLWGLSYSFIIFKVLI